MVANYGFNIPSRVGTPSPGPAGSVAGNVCHPVGGGGAIHGIGGAGASYYDTKRSLIPVNHKDVIYLVKTLRRVPKIMFAEYFCPPNFCP